MASDSETNKGQGGGGYFSDRDSLNRYLIYDMDT